MTPEKRIKVKKDVRENDKKSSKAARLTGSDLRRGILLSEILGPPRAVKPFSWFKDRRF